MSHYGGYSNRNNSDPWSRDIKPFETVMDRSHNISPMQNFGFNHGYNNHGPIHSRNNNRSLLPSPNDGRQGMQHIGLHQQQKQNMNFQNVPGNAFMPMKPEPNFDFQSNWNAIARNGNNMQGSNNMPGPSNMQPWPNMQNRQNYAFAVNNREFSQQVYTPNINNPSTMVGNRNEMNFQAKYVISRFKKRHDKLASSRPNKVVNHKNKHPSSSNQTNSSSARWITKKFPKKFVSKNEKPNKGSFCAICNLSFSTIAAKLAHLKTNDHNRQKQLQQNMLAKKTNQSTKKINKPKNDSTTYCTVCHIKFPGLTIVHMASEEHKKNKALNRPFCTHCQKFFRSPARFVKHCGTIAHKKNVAKSKKNEGDEVEENLIEDEFFTLDAIGIYDSDKDELSHGEDEEASQQSKQRKVTSVEKITISLPADSISQDNSSTDVVDAEKEKEDVSKVPVVSISQKDGVEVKSVNLKSVTAKVAIQMDSEPKGVENEKKEEDSEEKNMDSEPKGVDNEKKEEDSEQKKMDSEPKPEEGVRPADKEEFVAKIENVDSSEEFVGLSYIIAISGYYCKLCEVFIKDELQARNKHCQNEEHLNNYKIAESNSR